MRTSRRAHVSKAARVAQAVFKDVGLSHPTDATIEVIAFRRQALVRREPLRGGAQANLVTLGSRAVIAVRAGLTPGQRRFAIAHELGHHEVHRHISFLGLCTSKDMLGDYQRAGYESEANAFAAELLMPRHLVEPRCDVREVRWEVVRELAEDFAVSLTSAAIRFVEMSPERLALVCSKKGRIAWHRRTDDFGYSLERGAAVGPHSLAHDYFSRGELSAGSEEVSADAWVDARGEDEEVVEHSVALPKFGVVMSLVWFPTT